MKPDLRALIQYLRDCHLAGKIATFKEMDAIVNGNVQYKKRRTLTAALEKVKDEYNLDFVSVHGHGYKPANTQDLLDKCDDRKLRIKRTAERWRGDLSSVKVSELSQGQMLQYIQKGVELSLVETVTSEKTEKAIAQKVKTSSNPLDFYNGINVMELLGSVG